MFRQVFAELQVHFDAMLVEYWELRKVYNIEIVTHKHFDSLPAEFRCKREAVLSEYWLFFRGEMDAFLKIPQADYEAEVDEAIAVFSSVESSEDFRIFLDLLHWMPMNKLIKKKLFSEKYVDKLRDLLKQSPMINEEAPDMDIGHVLSASSNHEFGSMVLMLFSIPTTNEQGVTSLQDFKNERDRKNIARKIIEDEVL